MNIKPEPITLNPTPTEKLKIETTMKTKQLVTNTTTFATMTKTKNITKFCIIKIVILIK